MKRYGNIYDKIYDYENLKMAHKQARRNKTFYQEVKMVDKNEEKYLKKLQEMLVSKTYKTSQYDIFTKNDTGKEREIYRLPYYPDRICQWAIMIQVEDIFLRTFVDFSCASIPYKGTHYALNLLIKYMKDVDNTTYCLKLDIRKFFPNIDHTILKELLKKKIKDPDLLWLFGEIIDSVPGNKGVPIGNYTSQYFANFYLTYFDHWLKEEMKVEYVVRYMDDVVILHKDKNYLHWLNAQIANYLQSKLKLELKDNYQVFPSRVRGIDFVGYRHFGDYILLRKSTAKRLKKKMRNILAKVESGQQMSYSDWCSINSYKGWLMWCDGYNLTQKYIAPLKSYADDFYREAVLKCELEEQC
jgi:RNA-directed DNA polymerase